jgi:polysaccharide biosynthesis protein PslG
MAGAAGVYSLRVPRRSLFVAVVAAGLLMPAAAGARTIPFGFNDASTPQRLQDSHALGASVGRFFLCWCDVEPEPARYDLALLDRLYADFLAHGIRPVVDVVGTPTWARAECASRPRPCLYPPAEAELPRWRELFRVLAQRYPDLFGVEVWNEANLAHFWKPRVDAARYVRLLKAAHAGVRRADSDLPVVAGALCLCGGGKGGLGDVAFLERMYRAGARGSFDALSVHDYPTDLPVIANARDKLAGIRRVRERHGDRGTPLWVTEAGISTAAGGTGGHPRLSEALQARALAALAKTFRQARDVDVAIFFRFADITRGFTTWEDGLGIAERADGSAKPAAAALGAAMRDGRPYRRPGRVRVVASPRRVEVDRPVLFRARGLPAGPPNGRRVFLWDVGGGGFFADTGARPARSRVWRRPGRYRVGVRAGDELDAGEGFATVVVTPRRSRPRR